MNRHSFISAGGAGLLASTALDSDASAAEAGARPFFEFRIYRLQIGAQVQRMNSWAENQSDAPAQEARLRPGWFFQ